MFVFYLNSTLGRRELMANIIYCTFTACSNSNQLRKTVIEAENNSLSLFIQTFCLTNVQKNGHILKGIFQ